MQAGVLGSLLYLLCPAVGPVWAQTPGAPRNCMPSMHLTWALLLFCYSPRWLRPFAAIFALLTALATLGLGEHYVLALVAALPFTWLMLRCNNEALLKRLVHRLRRSRRQKKGRESLLSRPSALPADPD